MRRSSVRAAIHRLGFALVLLAGFAACQAGRTFYVPDTAGVVETRERQADGRELLRLDDGRQVTVDTKTQLLVLESSIPEPGDLLLAGVVPRPWVARLTGADPCFLIGGSGTEDGDAIEVDAGVRLPKAAEFDRAHYDESEHRFNGGGFCVNAAGEVTAIR
jgi:hypothetical protein